MVSSFPFSLEGERKRFLFHNQSFFVISPIKSIPFLKFSRDHLRSTLGITCGRGSFAVHFGDHLRSRDHLRLGIICGTVQYPASRGFSPAWLLVASRADFFGDSSRMTNLPSAWKARLLMACKVFCSAIWTIQTDRAGWVKIWFQVRLMRQSRGKGGGAEEKILSPRPFPLSAPSPCTSAHGLLAST